MTSALAVCLLAAACTNPNAEDGAPTSPPASEPAPTQAPPPEPTDEPTPTPTGEIQAPTPVPTDPPAVIDAPKQPATELNTGTPVYNDRGNIEKELGDVSGIVFTDTGEHALTLGVLSFDPDLFCTMTDAPPSQNGKYIGLYVEVDVAEDYPLLGAGDRFSLQDRAITVYDANGGEVTLDDPTYGCIPSTDTLEDIVNPGRVREGWFVLDVPVDVTSVLIRPTSPSPNGGEYQLP